MTTRDRNRPLFRGRRRHELWLVTQGAAAGALALGGLVASIPLKTAASAYIVVRREVLDQTTGFTGSIGYHLSQMFYPVLPHVQDELSLMRAVRNGTLDPLYEGFSETADVLLLISAAGFTYLTMLYGRIVLSRRGPDARTAEGPPLRTVLGRGLFAAMLSPLFFHLLIGFTTLMEQYRRLSGLSWKTIRPLLSATGREILDDLGSRWPYTVYAALVGAGIFILMRAPGRLRR